MATAQTHSEERRHIPDRREHSRSDTAPHMNALDWIAMTLLVIGGVNWGLIGLFSFNLVAAVFGEMSLLSRIVYTLVGISAVYSIFTSTKVAKADSSTT